MNVRVFYFVHFKGELTTAARAEIRLLDQRGEGPGGGGDCAGALAVRPRGRPL